MVGEHTTKSFQNSCGFPACGGVVMVGFGVWGSWVCLRKNSADVLIHQHMADLLRKGNKGETCRDTGDQENCPLERFKKGMSA